MVLSRCVQKRSLFVQANYLIFSICSIQETNISIGLQSPFHLLFITQVLLTILGRFLCVRYNQRYGVPAVNDQDSEARAKPYNQTRFESDPSLPIFYNFDISWNQQSLTITENLLLVAAPCRMQRMNGGWSPGFWIGYVCWFPLSLLSLEVLLFYQNKKET